MNLARRPPPRSWQRRPLPARPSLTPVAERILVAAVLVASALGLALWFAGGLSFVLHGRRFDSTPLSSSLGLAFTALVHPNSPGLGWPPRLRPDLLPPGLLYLLAAAAPAAALAPLALGRRRKPAAAPSPASWATRKEAAKVLVQRPCEGRLVLGSLGRRLVAIEESHSLLVLGPTQSGKTSGLAIPALLEWAGPVIATSVKSDLVRETSEYRARIGRVLVYDPTAVTGRPGAGWSPVAGATSWTDARKMASGLCSVARGHAAGLEDAAFWYATAEKLLAPLLFAAASGGASMADVIRWVDTGEVDEILDILEQAGAPEALTAATASFRREERQLSSVYMTTETILQAFSDPTVLASAEHAEILPAALLDGGANTVYLVAPTREQERLTPVFVALVRQLLDFAFELAETGGGRLARPLLVVLDEAANVAPLDGLDALASTAASHGIQLVTIFQDLAQLEARYGRRGATVVNNHRAKLVFPGISDPGTLGQVSELLGDAEQMLDAETLDDQGRRSTTRSRSRHRLAPADQLRRLSEGEAVLLYGNLSPMRIRLRPFYADPQLAARAGGAARAPRPERLRARGQREFPH